MISLVHPLVGAAGQAGPLCCVWSCVSLITGLAGPAPRFPVALIAESFNLRSPPLVTAAIALTDGKFGAYMQVHIQNDGPVTIELESPAPGAAASDPKQVSPESGCSDSWEPWTPSGIDLVPGPCLSLGWRQPFVAGT